MKTMMISEHDADAMGRNAVDCRGMTRFLADYAALLLGSGATCVRIEKNVGRMAAAWGVETAMTIMPRHVHLSGALGQGEACTYIAAVKHPFISFDIVTRLSKLSWDVVDGELSPDAAMRRFQRIRHTAPANRWWVLCAAACANASFCRLFGGDFVAMGVVFMATLAGFYLKQVLTQSRLDMRVTFVLCAFVSAVIGATDKLFALGATPDIAIATSVLYLVPGIPFVNSFSDMIGGHYMCFFSRMTDALILTCCLSTGLCLGMFAMRVGMF